MNKINITIDSEKINEVLNDDIFVQAFEYVSKEGYVSCSMLQRKYPISYPKAKQFYEVMSLFKGAQYDTGFKMKVNFSKDTLEKVKNKEIQIDGTFSFENYLDA